MVPVLVFGFTNKLVNTNKFISKVEDNVEFTVTYDKTTYTIGENIEVNVTVKNISNTPIRIGAGTQINGKMGTVGIGLYADRNEVSVQNNLPHVLAQQVVFYGSLYAGESIDKEIVFYTSTAKNINKESALEVRVFLSTIIDNNEYKSLDCYIPLSISFDFDYNEDLIKLIDNPKNNVDDKLRSILLYEDDEHLINVRISFPNIDAVKKYVIEDDSRKFIDFNEDTGIVSVRLTKAKIIELLKNEYPYKIELYNRE